MFSSGSCFFVCLYFISKWTKLMSCQVCFSKKLFEWVIYLGEMPVQALFSSLLISQGRIFPTEWNTYFFEKLKNSSLPHVTCPPQSGTCHVCFRSLCKLLSAGHITSGFSVCYCCGVFVLNSLVWSHALWSIVLQNPAFYMVKLLHVSQS